MEKGIPGTPELIILRGLPGSGKSTLAAEWVVEDPAHRAEVNRDHLRQMMHHGHFAGPDTESQIMAVRNTTITTLLKKGISVISSDTNLPSRTVRDLAGLARTVGAEVSITDLCDVPLETCLRRNEERADKHPVPAEVIRDYHKRYVHGKPWPFTLPEEEPAQDITPYESDFDLPAVIIVDIDGTVALAGDRNPYDETRVAEDEPNMPVIDMIWAASDHHEARLVFFSGRTDTCYGDTHEWIRKYVEADPKDFSLHMRKAGDSRKDAVVKYEMFNEHIRGKYDVVAVFDDRDQCVALWREMGLQTYQVADGKFL